MSSRISYTDNELLRLVSENDRDAFETLYERYWPAMYGGAYKQLQDTDQCKDVVQDIFVDLWVRRSSLSIQHLKAYLLSAVRFQVYKLVDKQRVVESLYQPFRSVMTTGLSADGPVADKELAELFNEWLSTLPEKRKEIFLLHFRERLPTVEIASRLHISQKTVQNQLGMAVSDLRKRVIFFLSIAG